jgi:hypothetical protein
LKKKTFKSTTTGKSNALAQTLNAPFFGMGDIRRELHAKKYPPYLPRLLAERIRFSEKSKPFDINTARDLVKFANSYRICIIDGFPTSIENIESIENKDEWIIFQLNTDEPLRQQRLLNRAETTPRKWNPDQGESLRDQAIKDIKKFMSAQGASHFIFYEVDNNLDIYHSINTIHQHIHKRTF